jgi:hypothetical protein
MISGVYPSAGHLSPCARGSPFDKPFDKHVLSKVEGLRASGKKYTEIKPDTARAEPFDFAQDLPFHFAQDLPFVFAQDMPFDFAQDLPFVFAQDMPFDFAQDMPVEAPFASGMSLSDRHWGIPEGTPKKSLKGGERTSRK